MGESIGVGGISKESLGKKEYGYTKTGKIADNVPKDAQIIINDMVNFIITNNVTVKIEDLPLLTPNMDQKKGSEEIGQIYEALKKLPNYQNIIKNMIKRKDVKAGDEISIKNEGKDVSVKKGDKANPAVQTEQTKTSKSAPDKTNPLSQPDKTIKEENAMQRFLALFGASNLYAEGINEIKTSKFDSKTNQTLLKIIDGGMVTGSEGDKKITKKEVGKFYQTVQKYAEYLIKSSNGNLSKEAAMALAEEAYIGAESFKMEDLEQMESAAEALKGTVTNNTTAESLCGKIKDPAIQTVVRLKFAGKPAGDRVNEISCFLATLALIARFDEKIQKKTLAKLLEVEEGKIQKLPEYDGDLTKEKILEYLGLGIKESKEESKSSGGPKGAQGPQGGTPQTPQQIYDSCKAAFNNDSVNRSHLDSLVKLYNESKSDMEKTKYSNVLGAAITSYNKKNKGKELNSKMDNGVLKLKSLEAPKK